MALMLCSECGRSVSDKAATCVGCGAPIGASDSDSDSANADSRSPFLAAPLPSKGPPLSRTALRWRAVLAATTFTVGLIMTIRMDRGGNRSMVTLATLLLISGLCWLIVAILQNVMAFRRR
jgi:hypothetical protein